MSGSKDRNYEPSPRFWHSAQIIGEKAYIRGGCTQKYDDEEERDELLKSLMQTTESGGRSSRKEITISD